MKKIFTAIISLLCLTLSSSSMRAEGNGRFPKNLFVEFGVGYACFHKYQISSRDRNILLTPLIGYQFHPRWAVGIGVTFLTAKDEDFKDFPSIYKPIPNLFVSYDFLRFKHFSVFAQLQGTYGKDKMHYDGNYLVPDTNNHDLWECGARFGAAYELNSHFSARLRYLFIGYSKRSDADDYRRGVVGDNDFIMDAGLRPLELSLRYTF